MKNKTITMMVALIAVSFLVGCSGIVPIYTYRIPKPTKFETPDIVAAIVLIQYFNCKKKVNMADFSFIDNSVDRQHNNKIILGGEL